MEEFPSEAGINGGERILPSLPGQMMFVGAAIAQSRIIPLNEYVRGLLNLDGKISKSQIVMSFFSC